MSETPMNKLRDKSYDRNALYTIRKYPCGCSAEGSGDVPSYCFEHVGHLVAGFQSEPELNAKLPEGNAIDADSLAQEISR